VSPVPSIGAEKTARRSASPVGGQMGTPHPLPRHCFPPAQVFRGLRLFGIASALRFVRVASAGGASPVSVTLTVLIVGGCVSVEHYPSSWGAQPTAGGQCASISGAYADNGTRADGTAVRLSVWLNPTLRSNSPERFQLGKDLAQAQQVELELDLKSALLHVTAVGPNIRREWTFDSSKGQFQCRDGVIRITRWNLGNDIVILANKDTIDLYRTQDYLLVNSHGGGAGLAIVVVPVAGYSSVWARFPVPR